MQHLQPTGTATGEVVDNGTGADTGPAATDLKGRIVLWTPAGSSTEVNNALDRKLSDAGTAAIVCIGQRLSGHRRTPVLRLDAETLPALRSRLAEGPLSLALDGVGTSAETAVPLRP